MKIINLISRQKERQTDRDRQRQTERDRQTDSRDCPSPQAPSDPP